MNTRRNFVKQLGGLAAGTATLPLLSQVNIQRVEAAALKINHLSAQEAAMDEDFWYQVQKAYTVSPNFINLENGYFSLQADEVMEAQIKNIRMINEAPAFYMRRRQWEDRDNIKRMLATFAGVQPAEIALLRNTTEALNTVILGLDMEKGDSFVMSDQDYGSMLEAFKMRARRYGTVNNIISLPLHPKNDNEIVDAYEAAITPTTKAIHVTHLINISGQILPIRKISEMAHAKGVEVISDSAHAFAQTTFKIPELGCDYLGTSLHKWMGTPVGLGFLWVKKEKIPKIWPLLGDVAFPEDDIRKLEHIGTHACSSDLTVANAIRFHESIGSERKEARLRYLKNYWMEKVAQFPKAIINTPKEDARSCAIGNVGVKGIAPGELAKLLYDRYRIFTVAINHKDVKGVRITPHLYTTIHELDAFVAAMEELCHA